MTRNSYEYKRPFPSELKVAKREIEEICRKEGLDFFQVVFEMVTREEMCELAAYTGFPSRYPHWSFGQEFDQMLKHHLWDVSRIYEMVINNDPSIAYLMDSNSLVDQKMVMAHVYGHVDFFKNNCFFSQTNRKMLDKMANHASLVRRYINLYGDREVEEWLDICLSIDNLIDPHSVAIKRESTRSLEFDHEDPKFKEPARFDVSRDYLERHINTKDFMDFQKKRLQREKSSEKKFPPSPVRDVTLFLYKHAPLDKWQKNVLGLIRDEAYYFAPQATTKIMNEGWACVTGDTYIQTDRGFIPAQELVTKKLNLCVSDGINKQPVYDWASFENKKVVTIKTNKGYTISGSDTHRILDKQGEWAALSDLKPGREIRLTRNSDVWATKPFYIAWKPSNRTSLSDTAERAGVSLSSIIRYRNRTVSSRKAEEISKALEGYDSKNKRGLPHRKEIKIPTEVTPDLASFLGFLIGDGHISVAKREVGLTTGDEETKDFFSYLLKSIFGLNSHTRKDGSRWRIIVYSQHLIDFLLHLGLTAGRSARTKKVPDCVLRSPKEIIFRFLSAYFDSDGYAGKQGVILSSSSPCLVKTVQQLLLASGMLSNQIKNNKTDVINLYITGNSARLFLEKVGFGLSRKTKALKNYISLHKYFKEEKDFDTVVSVEESNGTVYDFSVNETHRYVAGGFVNHNSYWHSHVMTKLGIAGDDGIIDYALHCAGTWATDVNPFNPYKLGVEIFRDIEDRWNKGQFGPEWEDCDDIEKKLAWDKGLGLGREKIFEVRALYNDITFLETFLTPEFCLRTRVFDRLVYHHYGEELDLGRISLFDAYMAIKRGLLKNLTNRASPFIYVIDGNYKNRGELLLQHRHEGDDLDVPYAQATLENIYKIWQRPVHLQTYVDSTFTQYTHKKEGFIADQPGITADNHEVIFWGGGL